MSGDATVPRRKACDLGDLPDRLENGRYRIVRPLGAGVSKRVVVAHDRDIDRRVAIALLPRTALREPERARLRREIQITGQLGKHPKILTVHDTGEEGNYLYVVLDLVEGGSVAARLASRPGGLPTDEALTIARDVAEALSFAHAHGVVHRDVKPSNVLLTETGTALLADFGVMRLDGAPPLTETGDIVGTPAYMAPEVIQAGVADVRTDLYALGAMLFEMTCGRPPFSGEPMAVMWQHVQEDRPDPRELAPLDDAPAELILRLLSKDPDERPASAAEVAAALTGVLPRSVGTPALTAALLPPLPPPLDAASRRPFVGRQHELDVLEAAWRRASATPPPLGLIVGEPGIGKSRLAAALASRVHEQGALVLYGRCDEEPLTSYQPFVLALRQLLGSRPALADRVDRRLAPELHELGKLVPELRSMPGADSELPVAGEPQRYLLFEAVISLLAAASAGGTRLLLVLDDLQWADRPTLQLLRHLARDSRADAMIAATVRSDALAPGSAHPLAEAVDDVRRNVGADAVATVRLDGLDEQETSALVREKARALVGTRFVRRLCEVTAGNPFFIEETLRGLGDRRPSSDPVAALEALGVPSGAKAVIQRRLAKLERSTVRLLTRGAVCGREFQLEVVAAMLSLTPGEAFEALEDALDAGIVVEPAVDQYTFCHALIRETLYSAVKDTPRGARLHLAAGEALEAAGAPHAELARHFHAALPVGGAPKALAHGVEAARRAADALAYEEAIGHCAIALEALEALGQEGQPDWYRVSTQLGRLQWQTGDGSGARATFDRAAASARAAGDARRFARAALGFAGRWYDAERLDEDLIGLLTEGLGLLGPEDSRERARLLGALANARHFATTLEDARMQSAEAVEMAARLADPGVQVSVLPGRHGALLHVADHDERFRVSAEWLELASEVGDRETSALGLTWRIYDLMEAGEVDAARRLAGSLGELARELRQPLYVAFASTWRFVFQELDGDLEAAERSAADTRLFADRAQATFAKNLHAGHLFGLHRDRGQLADLRPKAEPLVAPVMAIWRAGYMAMSIAEDKDLDEPRADLRALTAARFGAVRRDGFWLAAMCILAENAVALDDRAAMAELAAQLEPYSDRCAQIGLAVFLGPVAGFIARLWAALGEHDRADALREQAFARCSMMGARTVEQRLRSLL